MSAYEGQYLQKGMNFRRRKPSVLLMSRRHDALYTDRIEDEGHVLVYQGHDDKPSLDVPNPRVADQPLKRASGVPSDNGKFFAAAEEARATGVIHEVHVYEKLETSVWYFRGKFSLEGAFVESDGKRKVCRFRLRLLSDVPQGNEPELEHTRVIPSDVVLEVWKRDKGACRRCGATTNLHYDHILPFSKGGTSLMAQNIQILCAKHNLGKGARVDG